jgi:16S rRNA (cytidine1402-2'-O)-methyltransferase
MALMLSGMPGQSFAFHGYIDRDVKESMKKLTKGSTHIFIEAPHRNAKTLEALLSLLPEKSDLCVAWDLTSPNQGVVSQPVSVWKKVPLPKIEKTPAIYLVCV